MFPTADMTQAGYVRIGAPEGAVASTAMIKGFQVPTEVAVANGINAATGTEITFPHMVTGAFTGAAYTTTIGVTNLADVSQTLTISFNPGEGTHGRKTCPCRPRRCQRNSAITVWSF
jgi:hypothetical protein